MTPVLFQNWAVLESPESLAPLLAACGHKVRNLRRVRWAYVCEEAMAVGSFPGVEGRFLIPDIILHFEDDLGPGLVAYEVKRPKVRPTEKDASKLRAYTRLGSMRAIERKVGCFLVGSTMVNEAAALSRNAPVFSWEQMLELQRSAMMRESPTLVPWLERTYALQGIGITKAPAPSAGNRHALHLLDALRRPVAPMLMQMARDWPAWIRGHEELQRVLLATFVDLQEVDSRAFWLEIVRTHGATFSATAFAGILLHAPEAALAALPTWPVNALASRAIGVLLVQKLGAMAPGQRRELIVAARDVLDGCAAPLRGALERALARYPEPSMASGRARAPVSFRAALRSRFPESGRSLGTVQSPRLVPVAA